MYTPKDIYKKVWWQFYDIARNLVTTDQRNISYTNIKYVLLLHAFSTFLQHKAHFMVTFWKPVAEQGSKLASDYCRT